MMDTNPLSWLGVGRNTVRAIVLVPDRSAIGTWIDFDLSVIKESSILGVFSAVSFFGAYVFKFLVLFCGHGYNSLLLHQE